MSLLITDRIEPIWHRIKHSLCTQNIHQLNNDHIRVHVSVLLQVLREQGIIEEFEFSISNRLIISFRKIGPFTGKKYTRSYDLSELTKENAILMDVFDT